MLPLGQRVPLLLSQFADWSGAAAAPRAGSAGEDLQSPCSASAAKPGQVLYVGLQCREK